MAELRKSLTPTPSGWIMVVGIVVGTLGVACSGGDDDLPRTPVAPVPSTESVAQQAEAPPIEEDGGVEAAAPQADALEPGEPTVGALPIEETRGVKYTTTQFVNIYAPEDPGPWPVVLVLHGSGGSPGPYEPLAEALASEGAVVFNVRWRVAIPRFRDAAEDVACAVRFARANAMAYGGDATRITLLAHSAGGAIGAVVALAGEDFSGDCLVTGGSALPDVFVGVANRCCGCLWLLFLGPGQSGS